MLYLLLHYSYIHRPPCGDHDSVGSVHSVYALRWVVEAVFGFAKNLSNQLEARGDVRGRRDSPSQYLRAATLA